MVLMSPGVASLKLSPYQFLSQTRYFQEIGETSLFKANDTCVVLKLEAPQSE